MFDLAARSNAACSCDVVPCGPVSQLIISVSLSPRASKASHALKQNHRNTNFPTWWATLEPLPGAQRWRLQAACSTRICTEKGASGATGSRPECDNCLDRLKPGNTLAATKLAPIGRSARNLMDVSSLFQERGADLV